MIERLKHETDDIKTIIFDKDNKVESIIFKDENTMDFSNFIELFKSNLRTIVAGEIVSWEDCWRFSKQTDAKSFEEFLDNVEQEGIRKGSRFSMTKPAKTGLSMIIIVLIIMAIAFLAMMILGGGIKL